MSLAKARIFAAICLPEHQPRMTAYIVDAQGGHFSVVPTGSFACAEEMVRRFEPMGDLRGLEKI